MVSCVESVCWIDAAWACVRAHTDISNADFSLFFCPARACRETSLPDRIEASDAERVRDDGDAALRRRGGAAADDSMVSERRARRQAAGNEVNSCAPSFIYT